MSQREVLKAHHAAVAALAEVVRYPLATANAVFLAAECAAAGDVTFNHPEKVAEGMELFATVGDKPPQEPEAALAYWRRYEAAAREFWDGFEGQVIDGTEVVRKR